VDGDTNEIDPAWWSDAFGVAGVDEHAPPERLSLEFQRLLGEPNLGETQRQVLEALAAATSATLKTGDWQQPFTPFMEFDGRRSILPSDLTDEQKALLARIAPLIEQPSLRARVADVAWFYGERSRTDLVDLAIDGYTAMPLTVEVWYAVGEDSWQRAFDLVRRRGKDGQAPIKEMTSKLTRKVLTSSMDDRFLVVRWAAMLRENARIASDTARSIAEHLVGLASDTSADPRLSRHLEREAAAWFGDSDTPAANACLERAARTYIAEADARIAADPKAGALVEGHFLEKAIATLQRLPRSYRLEHSIGDLIIELRGRLAASRESALEAMVRIESDPIDLTDVVAYARRRVSRKTQWEALAMFASLMPPLNYDRALAQAREAANGSISHIFSSATYTGDSRKVAATRGTTGKPDDPAVWAIVVQNVGFHAQFVAPGLILPAWQVLTFEHRYSKEWLTRVCVESPSVPEGHAAIWGSGLALGMAGDFGPAVAILVPQLEQLIRAALKSRGVFTLFVDQAGVESEKSLGALLDMPECVDVFGAGQVLELKAHLIETAGANLRNNIAHGLFTDDAAWSYDSIYAWWMCLRLVVRPLWQMTNEVPAG
jgi:hypothetical protein